MTDTNDRVVPLSAPVEAVGRSVHREVGLKRMQVILDRKNAGELVRALPAEDLYFLVREIGLRDAAPLVALASPEQFQGFVDLDGWRREETGGHLVPERVLAWLAVARQGGDEAHDAKLKALDLEVVEILLKYGLEIVDLREEEERPRPLTDAGDHQWFTTPCGNFLIAYNLGDLEGAELRRLVDDLYAEDAFGAARLLSAVRWELTSEMEEHALRFRNGRLEDLGFPPAELAASLYAYVDPDAELPPQPPSTDEVPGFFLAEFSGGSLLDRAAAAITGPDARARLDRGLMYLANTVLVADGVDPSDVDGVREAIARMRAYLDLALTHLAGGEVDRAATVLGTSAPKHLFQVGFSLTLRLGWRVDRLAARVGLPPDGLAALLDAPEGPVIAAVAGRRPRVAVALDRALAAGWPDRPEGDLAASEAPGADTHAGRRAFRSPADLEAVGRALGRAEALGDLAVALGLHVLPDPGPEAASLSTRALTAAARAAAGGAFTAEALPSDDAAQALASAVDAAGAVAPAFAEALHRGLAAAGPGHALAAGALEALALARLAAEVGPVIAAGEAPDPALLTVLRVAG